jgi:outer membrane protein assembly factor BamD
MRAEEEYRQLIMQYPDSKLVPQAKQRLREVQEVIAEREFEVGRFYYMRQSYPAAIARLKSLADQYPLYSKADEALYLLGQSYEGEINMLRSRPSCSGTPPRPAGCMMETAKSGMIADFTKGAAEAYGRILTRYPLMDRADDAKARLVALQQPVPRPTKAAVAENKAEANGRKPRGALDKVLQPFEKHPSVTSATKNGEPTLVDPTPMSASDVIQEATRASLPSTSGGTDSQSVSLETVGQGTPPPSDAAPRSDATAPAGGAGAPAGTAAPPTSDANELKPNVGSDANELKPNVSDDNAQALPPPQQVNQIQPGAQNQQSVAAGQANGAAAATASSSEDAPASDADMASSKKKKKKGLHKIVPF